MLDDFIDFWKSLEKPRRISQADKEFPVFARMYCCIIFNIHFSTQKYSLILDQGEGIWLT